MQREILAKTVLNFTRKALPSLVEGEIWTKSSANVGGTLSDVGDWDGFASLGRRDFKYSVIEHIL